MKRSIMVLMAIYLVIVSGYSKNQPNIVLIFADDLGYTGLSSFGSAYYQTPNIDQLCEEGMKFTQGYAAATVCAPSRASVLSGQYSPRHGVLRVTNVPKARKNEDIYRCKQPDGTPFSNEIITMAEMLKRGGYVTGMFGKWHLHPGTPGEQGFDSWIESAGRHFNFKTHPEMEIPDGEYLTDFMTDHAIEFIRENRNRPFFLYLPDFLVHKPLEAKPELIEKYENIEGVGNQRNPVHGAMTESLDYSVGRIYETLKELGLLENTLIVFTSDNGAPGRTLPDGTADLSRAHTDNVPLRDGKGLMYEGGIRVPYIFYWKDRITPGSVSDEPIINIDLYPTFAELAGVDLPESQIYDGVSLLPLIFEEAANLDQRPLFWHYPNYGPASLKNGKVNYTYIPTDVVRYGDYKLLEFYHCETEHIELYNLKDDISELNNLVDSMPEKADELYRMLVDWREQTGAILPVSNPDFNLEKEVSAPNIVYLLVDDMGIGDLSCYNEESKIKTTSIDALAKEGVMFTDAHSAASICTPTRYGIMTGRYSWRTPLKERVLSGYDPCLISPDRETVAKLMKRNGYHTALIGKWHLGLDWQAKDGEIISGLKNDIAETEDKIDFSKPILNGPIQAGFDYFYGVAASWDFPPYIFIENDMISEVPLVKKGGLLKNYYPDISIDELKKNNRDYPLVTWRQGYASQTLNPEDAVTIITDRSIQYIQEQKKDESFFLMVNFTAPHTPVLPRDEFVGKSDCGIYGDFCLELDQSIGRIIQQLKEEGLFENTLLIFTADNGASLRSIPMKKQKEFSHSPSYIYKGYKARLDEGGHRIPFIATWPGNIASGSANKGAISLNDLYATCAEIVGEDVAENAGEDSFSILSMLLDEEIKNPDRDVIIHSDFTGYFAIRHEQWKLVYHRDHDKIALYDIKADPGEQQNIISEHPDIKEMLTGKLTDAVLNGRTTPGADQNNDGPTYWEQLYWMERP